MSKLLCYVGAWNCRPIGCPCTPFRELLHPREFQDYFNSWNLGKIHVWTNNPLVVDCFTPDQVVVCFKGNTKLLSEHPKYPKWGTELSPGEFWSMVGEDWVGEQQ